MARGRGRRGARRGGKGRKSGRGAKIMSPIPNFGSKK